MTDLRTLPDNELSTIVYNSEQLYQLRHASGFLRLINDLFVYRPAQLALLFKHLQEEVEKKKGVK